MKGLHVPGILICLLLATGTGAATSDDAPLPSGCDETLPCLLGGLQLGSEQEAQIRDLMASARRQQDELRDDTYRRIRDLLTPEQGNQLDDIRSRLLMQRAQDLRQQAASLQERARTLKKHY